MRAALAATGMPSAAIEAELARLPVPVVEWIELDADDEGISAALFLALDGQWRTAGMSGVRTGLINSEIAPTAALLGHAATPAMFADLRAMERAALQVWEAKR